MINVISKRLENGAMCCVIPKKGYNEKEVMIGFNYGSADTCFSVKGEEIHQPYGVAHFLEHKMFEDKDINIFDSFARLGLSANAYTNFNTTAYYFSGCENIEKGLDILMKMVSEVYLTDENIKKEKGIITQEINMYKDDPYWQIYFDVLKGMYSENPIRESIAGDVCDIENITKEIIEKSYESFYTYENCIIIGCGDFDSKGFFEQAEKLKLNNIRAIKKEYNDNIYKKEIVKNMAVNKPIYHIGFRDRGKGKTSDRYCISNIIMNLLFSGSSALYERLFEKGLIDEGFNFEVLQGINYGCTIVKGSGSNYERILDETIKEVHNFVSYGISREYIERIKNKLKTQMIFNSENISSIVSFAADCFSKNTEMLDIYNNYDKINIDEIISTMKEQYTYDNAVFALVKENK